MNLGAVAADWESEAASCDRLVADSTAKGDTHDADRWRWRAEGIRDVLEAIAAAPADDNLADAAAVAERARIRAGVEGLPGTDRTGGAGWVGRLDVLALLDEPAP